MRLIVIGGGAAGFFAAVTAARIAPGLEVIILERSNKVLSKVRISGGGRCNVTHACFSIPDMVRNYPRGQNFVKKTFHHFFTTDTVKWFEERGVRLQTENDGRMFPVSDSSETIIRTLLNEADRYKVEVRMNRDVKAVKNTDKGYSVLFPDGSSLDSDFVVIATGGFPKASMFDWIRATGHRIEDPVPSLFTFNLPGNDITKLMGVASSAAAKIRGLKVVEEGPVLITHWGLSGPAVLRLSARAARDLARLDYQFTAIVNWCPEFSEQTVRHEFSNYRSAAGASRVMGKVQLGIPQRLWEFLCGKSGVGEHTRWADLTAMQQNTLSRNICAMELEVSGKTTYKEEFVTAGGVDLSQVDANTMESRISPGLYFAGEILDVDGVTGGFNFQHAWTSGWIAGKNVAERSGGK